MNILNVEKVSKTYGEKELFNNISLGINSGDKIGLIGVNGTGKSTLLKIIAGVEEPDEGQVVKGKGIELAYLAGKGYAKHRSDLFKKVNGIASVANIPEISAKSELIHQILHTDYLDHCGIKEFEHIRESLRNLMKYIPHNAVKYDTNFSDDILSTEWKESELENDSLKKYKAKAEYYVRQHQDNSAHTYECSTSHKCTQ